MASLVLKQVPIFKMNLVFGIVGCVLFWALAIFRAHTQNKQIRGSHSVGLYGTASGRLCRSTCQYRINECFWETAHLPLSKPNINTYFSLWAKCLVWGGVGGQFPRNIH